MLKKIIRKLLSYQVKSRYLTQYLIFIKNTKRKHYRSSQPYSQLYGPLTLDPQYVEMENFTRLQPGTKVISSGGKLIIKKFSAVGAGCTIIPGSHIPTVGLPQFLSQCHINDTATHIVIEEDAWVGAQCILLSHCHIGRGAVVGAGSIVTKEIPPYAIVAGAPCRIKGVRFSLEQVLQHEAILYPPEERMKRSELEELYATQYAGLRVMGTSEISPEDQTELARIKQQYGIRNYESCQ